MTICVAAIGQEGDEPRIVLVSDSKVSTETWSSETGFKLEELWLGRLIALYSGDPSAANELAAIYRSHFATVNLEGSSLQEELRAPLQVYKNRIANAITGKRLGLKLDDFLARKDQIPEDVLIRIYNEILSEDRGVDLIAAGFFADDNQEVRARLFTIIRDDVGVERHFACIGSGAEAAIQALHRREQVRQYDLATTLYHAYEAKKAAELSPKVGRDTQVFVLEPGAQGQPPYRLRRVHHQLDALLAGR
jgi:hypothetical protein